jgi:hypothetical protein
MMQYIHINPLLQVLTWKSIKEMKSLTLMGRRASVGEIAKVWLTIGR